MAITRFDPFRDVVTLQSRLNSLFRDFNDGDSPLTTASFVPAVDIYEDPQKVVLKLEVPGIEEKDLDIRVENHTLTVKGERKFEKEEKEESFHRIERRYGSFYRAFTLPSTVDDSSCSRTEALCPRSFSMSAISWIAGWMVAVLRVTKRPGNAACDSRFALSTRSISASFSS